MNNTKTYSDTCGRKLPQCQVYRKGIMGFLTDDVDKGGTNTNNVMFTFSSLTPIRNKGNILNTNHSILQH